MESLDLSALIVPPEGAPRMQEPIGTCHRLIACDLQRRVEALEAQRALDLEAMAKMEARLHETIYDWVATLMQISSSIPALGCNRPDSDG